MSTRSEIYREVLRLDRDLKAARTRLKEVQMTARVTGAKLPGSGYADLWSHIHELEGAIKATRLRLLSAQETAAERFVAMARAEYPAVFASLADRAGLEMEASPLNHWLNRTAD